MTLIQSSLMPGDINDSIQLSNGKRPGEWPGLLLVFAASCVVGGIDWDISWHCTIGRDAFWTPAHMVIYLGGILGGCVGGWQAFQYTFLKGPEEKAAGINVLGACAPLGAWVAIWGALAMLTAGPFDNWWHGAYGLDVTIISPPHVVLGLGMFCITFAALLTMLAWQNLQQSGHGGRRFIYVGGLFVVLANTVIFEQIYPNYQHAASFYMICAGTFPFCLVFLGRAGRISWSASQAAAIYILVECLLVWILPFFPAHPRLAPIFNPVTHMVPPPFPLLLILPALAIDLILRGTGEVTGIKCFVLGLVLGTVFLAVFVPAQWFFSSFLLTPSADNAFFAGTHFWGYRHTPSDLDVQFSGLNPNSPYMDMITLSTLSIVWILATVTSWLGLLFGTWMRKVQR